MILILLMYAVIDFEVYSISCYYCYCYSFGMKWEIAIEIQFNDWEAAAVAKEQIIK